MPAPKRIYRLCLQLLLLVSIPSYSQPGQKNTAFFIYEDTSRTFNAQQALTFYKNGGFRELHGNNFNPGFTHSVYWLAYQAERNLTGGSQLLYIGDHHINRIHFYYAGDSVAQQLYETGDYYPFSQRPLPVKSFYFPVDKKGIYLARVDKSNESLQMIFWLTSSDKALRTEGNSALVVAILSGMMALMIIFGLYLFFISRERIYFYYICYLCAGWLWVLANSGYGFQYLWPEHAWFASKSRPVFAVAAGTLSMLFMVHFVGGGKRARKIAGWLSLSMWVFIALILSFNNNGYQSKWWMYIQYLIPIATLLYVVLVLVYVIRKAIRGNRSAVFYLAGALVLIAAAIMQAGIQLGSFPEWQYFFSNFGMGFGYLMESIILTAGIVYRFDQYRKEKERLLVEMNQRQQDHIRVLMEVQEAERSQVANQLHDVAGSLLSAAKLNLSSLRENEKIPETADTHAAKAEEAVGMVSDMVRNLSHALSPVMLEKVGFRTSLEKVVAIVNASGKISIRLLVMGFEKYEVDLNHYYTALYGITYELLNNIVKHAGAKHVLVQVSEHEECFSLIVEDDGRGLDPEEKESLGMTAIQAKINYFSGSVAFDKNQPSGLIVTIEIPIIRHAK